MQRIRRYGGGGVVTLGLLALGVLRLVGSTSLRAQDAVLPSDVVESLDVHVVNVEVLVAGKDGKPVEALTNEDFEVFEDGRKMPVAYFLPPAPDGSATTSGARSSEGEIGRSAASGDAKEYIALLVDNLSIQPQNRRHILDALRVYLKREGDAQFLVSSYDGYLNVRQPFTGDRELILASVESLESLDILGASRYASRQALFKQGLEELADLLEKIRNPELSRRGPDDIARELGQRAKLIESYAEAVRAENQSLAFEVGHLINALAALPGRKALVYISEGMPMRPGATLHQAIQDVLAEAQLQLSASGGEMEQSFNDARATSLRNIEAQTRGGRARGKAKRKRAGKLPNEFQRIAALANSAGVSFYALIPQGGAGVAAEYRGDAGLVLTPRLQGVRDQNFAEPLQVMADNTGGEARIGRDIGALLDQARWDFKNHYSLGYSPGHAAAGRNHELKVKVKRKRTELRYRRGYIHKPANAKLADRVSASLLLQLDENPLGVAFELGTASPTTKRAHWIVPVEILVPMRDLVFLSSAATHVSTLQLLVAASDATGSTAPVQSYDLRIEVPDADLDRARSDSYRARIQLKMRAGRQRLAIGVVDTVGGTSSFLGRSVTVGSMTDPGP